MAAATPILEQNARIIDKARASGTLIVFVRVEFRPGHPEVDDANMLFSAIKRGNLVVEGTEGAAIHELVRPSSGDIIITKRRMCAMATTELDLLLRGRSIRHIILMGFSTSGVILSTLRTAADRDYRITVIGDACRDADAEVHRVLVEKVFPRQATVITATVALSE